MKLKDLNPMKPISLNTLINSIGESITLTTTQRVTLKAMFNSLNGSRSINHYLEINKKEAALEIGCTEQDIENIKPVLIGLNDYLNA